MGRSDGQFPTYRKYDSLDPEKWPSKYWERSYMCVNCQTHWPYMSFFALSPCCNDNTSRSDHPPDMRWPDAVLAANEVRFEKLYAQWNEEKSDEDLLIEQTLQEIEDINDTTLTEHT